ncbi:hypothetical protein HHI36_023274 [Cryptolaemus montrouzieri]|uniref:Homeobox domain-containing protein n=1 Tax=Cryptolaemus montrouzieri TaxID=559131 RepID=A0ABD2PGH6_9CUCU
MTNTVLLAPTLPSIHLMICNSCITRGICLLILTSLNLLQVKIWFQNRRTKWKKIDNISNAEAAGHKNHTITKDNSKSSDDKMRIFSKTVSQSSNSSLESDSKSSATSAINTDTTFPPKSFKDILKTNSLLNDALFQNQMDSAKDVLLNLTFKTAENS